ncbi:YeiH family protein [Dendrosporobacter sp. 1207_IL3150]|uniref:YeiH family protein n=1 Tax=Dendrosporobacter sp. 1207_IL3150 TaxID=3084054 RepID=UPI002FDAF8C2
MAGTPQSNLPWIKREDTWAIIIALALTTVITITYLSGGFALFKSMAVSISSWSNDFSKVTAGLNKNPAGLYLLFGFFLVAFTLGAKVMGYNVKRFVAAFTVLFILSVIITILGSNKFMKDYQLETPLLALMIGMIGSNLFKLPNWFQEGLRTEFYVKTGIVLMGATLPFTIIMKAGPLAMLQATIVAFVTFFSIYFAATKLFGLDPRFGATLGAGGSICGVSGSIAVGGACRAEKEHVSIAISLVVIWAVIMIAILPAAAKHIGMAPGPAGAWIGTSEFADAAGFAAAEQYNALADLPKGDDRAVKTFTLMKVVGRDMFVGLWALLAAILSVTLWEKKNLAQSERIDYGEVWRRFPKFVIGFFVASIFTTLIIANLDPKLGSAYSKDALGVIKNLRGWTFTWTFLSIGFTTRFRDLAAAGWKPFLAFTIGVLINVPLGYWLSNVIFVDYWLSVK